MDKSNLFHRAEVEAEHLILDVKRSEAMCLNYSVVEALKDGIWTSGKYYGKSRNGKPT